MYFRNRNNDVDDDDFEVNSRTMKAEYTDTNIDSEFDGGSRIINIFGSRKLLIILIEIIIVIILILLIKKSALFRKYYISLYGRNDFIVYLGDSFVDPGYIAYDSRNKNLADKVITTGAVDTNKLGTYQVAYTLKNVVKYRNVEVVKKPIGDTKITLVGDSIINLGLNEKYNELGYTAIDSVDGNITNDVKIDSNVDTSRRGVYKIIYSVINSGDKEFNVVRYVVVK